MLMLYTFLISKSIKHRNKDAEHTEPTEESTVWLKYWDFRFNWLLSFAWFYWWCVLTAYMSSPCHIELILSEKEEPVKKEVFGSSSCFDCPFFLFWLFSFLFFVAFVAWDPVGNKQEEVTSSSKWRFILNCYLTKLRSHIPRLSRGEFCCLFYFNSIICLSNF